MSLINNEETVQKGLPTLQRNGISKEKNDDEKAFVKKDKWSNDVEFLLSCISLSVGLGNVWRFPFIA